MNNYFKYFVEKEVNNASNFNEFKFYVKISKLLSDIIVT